MGPRRGARKNKDESRGAREQQPSLRWGHAGGRGKTGWLVPHRVMSPSFNGATPGGVEKQRTPKPDRTKPGKLQWGHAGGRGKTTLRTPAGRAEGSRFNGATPGGVEKRV